MPRIARVRDTLARRRDLRDARYVRRFAVWVMGPTRHACKGPRTLDDDTAIGTDETGIPHAALYRSGTGWRLEADSVVIGGVILPSLPTMLEGNLCHA